jgi:hypothetical protein
VLGRSRRPGTVAAYLALKASDHRRGAWPRSAMPQAQRAEVAHVVMRGIRRKIGTAAAGKAPATALRATPRPRPDRPYGASLRAVHCVFDRTSIACSGRHHIRNCLVGARSRSGHSTASTAERAPRRAAARGRGSVASASQAGTPSEDALRPTRAPVRSRPRAAVRRCHPSTAPTSAPLAGDTNDRTRAEFGCRAH